MSKIYYILKLKRFFHIYIIIYRTVVILYFMERWILFRLLKKFEKWHLQEVTGNAEAENMVVSTVYENLDGVYW